MLVLFTFLATRVDGFSPPFHATLLLALPLHRFLSFLSCLFLLFHSNFLFFLSPSYTQPRALPTPTSTTARRRRRRFGGSSSGSSSRTRSRPLEWRYRGRSTFGGSSRRRWGIFFGDSADLRVAGHRRVCKDFIFFGSATKRESGRQYTVERGRGVRRTSTSIPAESITSIQIFCVELRVSPGPLTSTASHERTQENFSTTKKNKTQPPRVKLVSRS